MATLGANTKVYFAPDSSGSPGTFTEATGIEDVDLTDSREIIDRTDFADTTGARRRLLGLRDLSATFGGQWDDADTGQDNARAGLANGTYVWMKVLWDGTIGVQCRGLIGKSPMKSSSKSGLVTQGYEWVSDGAPTVLP